MCAAFPSLPGKVCDMKVESWGRMASCGGLATRLLAVVRTFGPIDNRPQATSLPHKIVAAREETKM